MHLVPKIHIETDSMFYLNNYIIVNMKVSFSWVDDSHLLTLPI